MFCSRKGIYLIAQVLFLSLFVTGNVFSAEKKAKEPYRKYVHPRNYDLDLCDSDGSVILSYDSTFSEYKGYVNFTNLIKKDLPQKNDQITVYYKGKALNDLDDVSASLYDKDNNMIPLSPDNHQIFAYGVKKNGDFEGKLVFHLSENVRKSLYLELKSNKEISKENRLNITLKFKRVVVSTDTVKEEAAEKKAIRNNQEIEEVVSDIQTLDDIRALKAAEEAAKNASKNRKIKAAEEKAEAERLEKERLLAEQKEAEKKEAERLELQRLERMKEQEALTLALESANKVSRYEKEFLSDFMTEDSVTDVQTEVQIDEIDKNKIENVNEFDENGKTQLMMAAKNGNDWQIKTLINGGADINLKDKDGWTPLMYAVRYQESISCIDLLIDYGADVKCFNNFNYSALTIAACYNNNPEIIKKLLSYHSPSEREVLRAMVLLISENKSNDFMQIAKLNVFIENSVPVNAFYDGKNLLMYAAEYSSSTKIIKLLLDNDAVTTLRSSEGKTAFEYAKENKMLQHDDIYWALNN